MCWPPPRRRPRRAEGATDVWASHAVSEEDRLDREQAKQVLRRAARLALPYRRPALKALVFIVMSTSSAVRRTTAVALQHRPRHRRGRSRCAQPRDRAVRGGGDRGLSRQPSAVRVREYRRRGVPAGPAVASVRAHPTPVVGVLRPQQGRRAGVAHDRRHRIDERARAMGPAAVRVGGTVGHVGARRAVDHVVAAHVAGAARVAVHRGRLDSVPA